MRPLIYPALQILLTLTLCALGALVWAHLDPNLAFETLFQRMSMGAVPATIVYLIYSLKSR